MTRATKLRDDLTLQDWITVFAFIDAHPFLSHQQWSSISVPEPKVFTQPTLSRKIENRKELEERVGSHPAALSSKRPRVVTRPDVEQALVLWSSSMDEKGEMVNGQMLVEKRKQFEEQLDKAYNTKQYQKHRVRDSQNTFEGGDEEIVARVRLEKTAMQGEVVRISSDEEDDDQDNHPDLTVAEMVEMCKQLEKASLQRGALKVSQSLRRFRVQLFQSEEKRSVELAELKRETMALEMRKRVIDSMLGKRSPTGEVKKKSCN